MNLSCKNIIKIPFSKIVCSGNEIHYVKQVLDSGWLTTANKCFEFEEKFAKYVGAKCACAVNSCTAALHLALEALGVGPGDRVFVPTMTFTASAEIIRYLGADPIFLDVEYGTCLVTPEILQIAIKTNPGVKALVLVHFGGQSAKLNCDSQSPLPGIVELCRKNNIKLIQDAAHAFPTKHCGKYVGSYPDVTCFSFYANKTITTGEGGMLVTDDEEVYKRAKIMRLHGINRDIWNRFTKNSPNWEYDVVAPGYKYNMPDINAAIGLAQLEKAEEFRKERQRCFKFYLENLKDIPYLDLPVFHDSLENHSCHLFWIVLNEKCKISRNRFIELMSEAGIGTSVHYKPLHRMSYYRERYQLKPDDFPNAEKHWRGVVSLPVYPSLTDNELDYICTTIRKILK